MVASYRFSLILLALFSITLMVIAFYGLGAALIPLLLSALFAYLTFPLIARLEAWKIKRSIAILATFIFLILIISSLLVCLIPTLYLDAVSFFQSLPSLINTSIININALLSKYNIDFKINSETVLPYANALLNNISLDTFRSFLSYFTQMFGSIVGILLSIINVFLFPLFYFYIIADYEKLSSSFDKIVPNRFKASYHKTLLTINTILSGYIRGQLSLALIEAILYGIGLSLVGLKFGLVIGLITGLLCIIPYVGFTIGFTSALLVLFANYSSSLLIGVLVVFTLIQLLESFILTPKLVGNKVGLKPLESILAIIIGGNLLGFVGILIAIPVGGILKALMKDSIQAYQKSVLYTE